MPSPRLSSEQWERAQEIFLAAAELPLPEQPALVAASCAGDPEIRAEVESLLRADRTSDASLRTAVGSEVEVLLSDAGILGTRLGDYRVLREIGRGGMGAVYLAERDDQHYRKQVAIKVVKRGMDTVDVLGRFRHERQILANLDHPYVARLIDGGSTADGRPFFVMDYVQGEPIDVYCRTRNLDVPARLGLFLRVCEAVSEAHRNLIVHRDLKPGNILVTVEGIPKLLDFGVARLLQPGVDSGAPATSLSAGPLTPEYASPEQVRGLPATTAIDIYSLGAVLYELLTGQRAQRIQSRTPAEVERVVCHTEVTRPSAAAPSLKRQLAGDLDNIVLMAMRKERDRRYQSVDQMAEDIRRHLAGLTVRARQDSLSYRYGKFARRHQWAIAAACLISGSLIAGATIAMSQARQAQAARGVAEAQRRVADRERARAEAEALVAKNEKDRSERRLTEMVELADRSLYDVHSAIERLPGATEARQRIVTTTLQFLENLSRDVGTDDRLRYVLSVAYSKVADAQGYPLLPNLGDRAAALANYAKATEWIAPLLSREPDNPQYLLQAVNVRLRIGAVQDWEDQKIRAMEIYRGALPDARKLASLRPGDSEARMVEAGIYAKMALSSSSADPAQSLLYSRKQVALMAGVARDFPDNRDVKLELAGAYSQLGQAVHKNAPSNPAEPVAPFRRSIELREEVVARNPTDALARRGLMISYANLANLLSSPFAPSMGDAAGAALYYGKAVSIARELAANDPNNHLAQYDLANALLRYGWLDPQPAEREASLATLQQSEAILSQLATADPESISTARSLAIAREYAGHRLRDLGRLPEAVASYQRSLDLTEKFLASNTNESSLWVQALADENALAIALAMKGDRTAEAMGRKAIGRAQQWSRTARDRDRAQSALAAAYGNLGSVYQTLGDCLAAREAATHAIAEWKAIAARGGKSATETEHARAEELLKTCPLK